MREILWGLGFAVCHQLPTHSLFCGSEQIPWCARCTGLYWGALISAITLLILHPKGIARPPLVILTILCLGTLLLAVDALSDLFRLHASTNFTRLATGLWMGASLPPLLLALLLKGGKLDETKPFLRWDWLAATFVLAGLALWFGLTTYDWSWWALAGGTALGQIVLWGLCNLALAGLIIRRKASTKFRGAWMGILAATMLLLELFLLGTVHIAMVMIAAS
jgi:uncharacterized membrane protein